MNPANKVVNNDMMSWQYYLDNYYSESKKMFNKMQVTNVFLNLNPIDIHNLDFFKRIYIKQLGGLFYLNKVKNYKQGKITEVELVKITTDIY